MRSITRVLVLLWVVALAACAKDVNAPIARVVSAGNVAPASIVQLDGSGSTDPQGLPLFYHWAFRSLPQGSQARLNDPEVANPSFVADLPGAYVIELAVSNGILYSERLVVQVTASTCGAASPEAATLSAAPATPGVGQLVQLSTSVGDTDTEPGCELAETFSYAWEFVALPAGSHAALNNPALRNPSFTTDRSGDYEVRLVVTDLAGHRSQPKTLVVPVSETAACGTAAPTATVVAPTSGNAGAVVALAAQVEDPDALPPCNRPEFFAYAWSLEQLPAGSTTRLSDPGAATPSFVSDLPGTYRVRLVVTDSTGRASAPVTASITVSACGANPPVAIVTATPTPASVGDTVLVTASVTDADTACGIVESFRFSWTFDAVPAGSAAVLNNPLLANPSFVADAVGSYTLRLVVTDSSNRSSQPALVTLAVGTCGSNAPGAVIATTPATPSVGAPILLTSQVTDADNLSGCGLGQTFSYSWTLDSLPAGSRATLNSPAARQPSFIADLPGIYEVRLVVTDSTGRTSAPAFASITVAPCGNNPPSATIAASPASPRIGEAVQLVASVTDADNAAACGLGQTFAYAWTFDALPAGSRASLNDAGARQPSFVPDVAGSYILRLVVTDSTGQISVPALQEVMVSICGGSSPTVATIFASSTGPKIGEPVSLGATVADADNEAPCNLGQTFSYRWNLVSLPSGSAAQLNDVDALNPSFSPDVAGAYVVEFVVTDSSGRASSPTTLTVTAVTCGGIPPVVGSIVANPMSPMVSSVVQLTATVSDADNDPTPGCNLSQEITYQWRMVRLPAGSNAGFNNAAAENPSFTPDKVGEYSVELQVTDSTGRASNTASLAIVVQ